ncbi:pilin [Roseateles amylovorans]|uniref:Pilin n=1 Tax=Roseateles amylovorans TaxID=2978473 RepID=A0ABY6B1W0_9BURK|nr:pilin [Roseateles amylovorans]UXH78186.1 pilin [Roseateles amylovorans]
MKSVQRGFTLLELIVVVAVIGILAALALPAYSDYAKKTKVSELMMALSQPKAAVLEYMDTMNTFPTPEQLDLGPVSSNYIDSRSYLKNSDTEAVIAVVVKAGSIAEDLDGRHLMLTATAPAAPAGVRPSVSWKCSGDIPEKYLTVSCKTPAT